MTAQEDARDYIEFIIELMEAANEAIETADDKMKQAGNHTFIMLGSSDDMAMGIGAALQTNHDEIHNMRRRNKKVREKLDEWWRNV